ncbi:MAG: LexA family protein [Caldimicrobium sp.]|jgi:SOS-response transcriptional repressor LexA|uniref:DNA polymerase V n=1 Tax=Caldimicrobium thiodismutans TaxID=1653476 RepID=A0A2N7PJ26_9BACT|nr:MAG: DNA polymerase V [Caldimicrobium thiodismutans]
MEILFLGYISAGFPSQTEETLLESISMEEWLIPNPSSTFLIKVFGESMVGAGILPGDYVLVDRSLFPKNNDIVVVRIEDEWTMKYFFKEKGKIILKSANPSYPDLIFTPDRDIEIFGVIIAVIRKYR